MAFHLCIVRYLHALVPTIETVPEGHIGYWHVLLTCLVLIADRRIQTALKNS